MTQSLQFSQCQLVNSSNSAVLSCSMLNDQLLELPAQISVAGMLFDQGERVAAARYVDDGVWYAFQSGMWANSPGTRLQRAVCTSYATEGGACLQQEMQPFPVRDDMKLAPGEMDRVRAQALRHLQTTLASAVGLPQQYVVTHDAGMVMIASAEQVMGIPLPLVTVRENPTGWDVACDPVIASQSISLRTVFFVPAAHLTSELRRLLQKITEKPVP